jgi:hypothetical protein
MRLAIIEPARCGARRGRASQPNGAKVRLAIVFLLLAAGCPAPPRRVTAKPPTTEKPRRAPDAQLVQELQALILDGYRYLGGGYQAAYLDGLAQDDRLVLIDVKPGDVLIGHSPDACQIRRHIVGRDGGGGQISDGRIEIVSQALETRLSADRTVAWTYDYLSYRVRDGDRKATVPLRTTAVYQLIDGRWLKFMEHVSYATPVDEAIAARTAPVLEPIPEGEGGKFVAEEAKVRELLKSLLASDKAVAEHIDVRPGALLLGPDNLPEARGDKIKDVPTVRALFNYAAKVTDRGIRVDVSDSGQTAWAAAVLEVEVTRDGMPVRLGVRATWVLDRVDGLWRVVQTHVSLPITGDALSLAVFGRIAT